MATTISKEDIPDMTAFLRRPQEDGGTETERPSKALQQPAVEPAMDPPTRLPHRIPGGLKGVSDDLERHARDWRNTFRLLEQQRPMLETAESERERLHDALARIVPRVHDANRALGSALEIAKKGDFSDNLSTHFSKNLDALDELESIAEALTANLLQMRATWEQYARTIIRAQKMRDELRTSGS